jgi:hypothetical protein
MRPVGSYSHGAVIQEILEGCYSCLSRNSSYHFSPTPILKWTPSYLKERATNSHRWIRVSSEQFHQGKSVRQDVL